jgi:hypothetical protein
LLWLNLHERFRGVCRFAGRLSRDDSLAFHGAVDQGAVVAQDHSKKISQDVAKMLLMAVMAPHETVINRRAIRTPEAYSIERTVWPT